MEEHHRDVEGLGHRDPSIESRFQCSNCSLRRRSWRQAFTGHGHETVGFCQLIADVLVTGLPRQEPFCIVPAADPLGYLLSSLGCRSGRPLVVDVAELLAMNASTNDALSVSRRIDNPGIRKSFR